MLQVAHPRSRSLFGILHLSDGCGGPPSERPAQPDLACRLLLRRSRRFLKVHRHPTTILISIILLLGNAQAAVNIGAKTVRNKGLPEPTPHKLVGTAVRAGARYVKIRGWARLNNPFDPALVDTPLTPQSLFSVDLSKYDETIAQNIKAQEQQQQQQWQQYQAQGFRMVNGSWQQRPGTPAQAYKPQPAQQQMRHYLDANQYEQIRDITLEIMQRRPPSAFFYVPVGRDPAPIAAFMELLSPKGRPLARTLPASGLKQGVIEGREQAWFDHFDRFIPKEVLTGNRHILLVDRASSGATLEKVRGILRKWLKTRGSKVSVNVLALSRREVTVPWIDITSKPELVAMNQDHYAPVAEWPRYEVGVTPPEELTRRTTYDEFKMQLLKRMARDQQLDAVIHTMSEGH